MESSNSSKMAKTLEISKEEVNSTSHSLKSNTFRPRKVGHFQQFSAFFIRNIQLRRKKITILLVVSKVCEKCFEYLKLLTSCTQELGPLALILFSTIMQPSTNVDMPAYPSAILCSTHVNPLHVPVWYLICNNQLTPKQMEAFEGTLQSTIKVGNLFCLRSRF